MLWAYDTMIVVTILPFTQFYRFHYFFYPGDFWLIASDFQKIHFDVCFCVSDDYCPNFWPIILEVLLCSTASIEFNCYFQLQLCFLLLESLRQEMLSSAFVRQSRDPAIQVDGRVLSEVVAPWIFGFSVTPNTPPVRDTVQHVFWYKDPLQDAFEESSSSP